MLSLGISPGDGLKILEYEESAWLIKEIIALREKERIKRILDAAEAHRMAITGTHKKGVDLYDRWFAKMNNKITDPVESGE